MKNQIENFLDDSGRLKQLPAKYSKKLLAYGYLATKFENDVQYTEQEVNAIIGTWHTFSDHSSLRRGLIDSGYLIRTQDGNQYWKNNDKEQT